MDIEHLKSLISSGHFHHATYRTDFACGLHVYRHSVEGDADWGFRYVGMFSERDKAVCNAAYDLVRKTGVYEGSYR